MLKKKKNTKNSRVLVGLELMPHLEGAPGACPWATGGQKSRASWRTKVQPCLALPVTPAVRPGALCSLPWARSLSCKIGIIALPSVSHSTVRRNKGTDGLERVYYTVQALQPRKLILVLVLPDSSGSHHHQTRGGKCRWGGCWIWGETVEEKERPHDSWTPGSAEPPQFLL